MDWAQSFIDTYFKRAQMQQQSQQFEEEQARLTAQQQAQQQYQQAVLGQQGKQNEAENALKAQQLGDENTRAAQTLQGENNRFAQTNNQQGQSLLMQALQGGAVPVQPTTIADLQAAQPGQVQTDAQRVVGSPQGGAIAIGGVPVPQPGQVQLGGQTLRAPTDQEQAQKALALEYAKKDADRTALYNDAQNRLKLLDPDNKMDDATKRKMMMALVLPPEAFKAMTEVKPEDDEKTFVTHYQGEHPGTTYTQAVAAYKNLVPKDHTLETERLLDAQQKQFSTPHDKIVSDADNRLALITSAQQGINSGNSEQMKYALLNGLHAVAGGQGGVRVNPANEAQILKQRGLGESLDGLISQLEGKGPVGAEQAHKIYSALDAFKKDLSDRREVHAKAIRDIYSANNKAAIVKASLDAMQAEAPASTLPSVDSVLGPLLQRYGYGGK